MSVQPATSRFLTAEPAGEPQPRDDAVADGRCEAGRGLSRPPPQRGDLRRRRRNTGDVGEEHRHPHLDALERGRRANLGERLRRADPDPQLLGELALEALERRLAGVGLSAGQVEDVRRRTLADQQQPARAQHGGGDDAKHALRYTAHRGRLARSRRHPHGRRPHDPARGTRTCAVARRAERRRLAGAARARRPHADRPAQRRRAHGRPGAGGDHGPAIPLDGIEDRAFWAEWASDWRFGTPVYYGPHLPGSRSAAPRCSRRSPVRSPAACSFTAWAAATARG